MAKIKAPKKPFENYKWRWATVEPSEGLNVPSVYLGVLRALKEHEGEAPSSKTLLDDLRIVEEETRTRINLARSEERNLIRNSGQYWKALNLLRDNRGEIILTDFGTKVAAGEITKTEFASTIIKTLELPNKNIEPTKEWEEVDLKIKPLELILQILIKLQELDEDQAYVTTEELIKIIIPLAGAKAEIDDYILALRSYRDDKLDLTDWPNCAPKANDQRMANEFLLFLWHYGFCQKRPLEKRYYLKDLNYLELDKLIKLDVREIDMGLAVQQVRETDIPALAERRRILSEVIHRPQQPRFRQNVLIAYRSKCLFTGVDLKDVLEAAHIMPVEYKGNDRVENGLCLRSDIHILFDSGHLRLDTSGNVHLSQTAARDINYGKLPRRIKLPEFVNKDYIDWRWKYY
jgi:HNH endonuclease/AlwI restriction endonuclease